MPNLPAHFTTTQAAEWLAVGPDKIGDLIRSGQLVAIDVSLRGTGKPRWRIPREELEAFVLRRQSQAPVPQTRRRRKAAALKEFV
jgi:excisionase family DNA binding protein